MYQLFVTSFSCLSPVFYFDCCLSPVLAVCHQFFKCSFYQQLVTRSSCHHVCAVFSKLWSISMSQLFICFAFSFTVCRAFLLLISSLFGDKLFLFSRCHSVWKLSQRDCQLFVVHLCILFVPHVYSQLFSYMFRIFKHYKPLCFTGSSLVQVWGCQPLMPQSANIEYIYTITRFENV